MDQILTKSISRFARNMKECIATIRKLKVMGVRVLFEKEGIDTMNMVLSDRGAPEKHWSHRIERRGYPTGWDPVHPEK